jgi:hypothetical protein
LQVITKNVPRSRSRGSIRTLRDNSQLQIVMKHGSINPTGSTFILLILIVFSSASPSPRTPFGKWDIESSRNCLKLAEFCVMINVLREPSARFPSLGISQHQLSGRQGSRWRDHRRRWRDRNQLLSTGLLSSGPWRMQPMLLRSKWRVHRALFQGLLPSWLPFIWVWVGATEKPLKYFCHKASQFQSPL